MLKKLKIKHAISSNKNYDRLMKMKSKSPLSLWNEPGFNTIEGRFMLIQQHCHGMNILVAKEPEVVKVEITPELKKLMERFYQ
jgi:hypothetical protein